MHKAANLHRPIIAVTGSCGKTTTKEMIASILQRRWRIFKSPKNKNFISSTRRHARLLRPVHQAVVLEYGMIDYGNIKRHCQYIQPNIGMITNVGRSHIGRFGGRIQGVAKAKSELIRYMKSTGTLLLNTDDPYSKLLQTKGFKGKIIRIGIHNQADYRADQIRYARGGMTFRVQLNGTSHPFYIPILGRHHIYNALFAIAVSHRLGFTPKQMQDGLRTYVKPKGRMYIYNFKNDVTLVDDSYNANPDTVKSALDTVSHIGTKTNIAVLGSMLELGSQSISGHREVGRHAARTNITSLYTLGRNADQIIVGAKEAGFPAKNIHRFVSRRMLSNQLIQQVRPGTTILVKGSHHMRMDQIVTYLKRYFTNKRHG